MKVSAVCCMPLNSSSEWLNGTWMHARSALCKCVLARRARNNTFATACLLACTWQLLTAVAACRT